MDKVTRQWSTNHNLFDEKGEPKRYRTEVLPLTSLTARPHRLTADSSESALLIPAVTGYATENATPVWPSGMALGWVSRGTSVRIHFGSPFSSKALWSVDTVLWLCPSQLMKH